MVRNISVDGAFLELEPPSWLPFQFQLQIEGDPRLHTCELRHARPDGIGIRFYDALANSVAVAPQIDSVDTVQWLGQSPKHARNPTGRRHGH